jgi:phosphopantothenoylcysteine decarboxylase/phosphopantothenate--cysteine ligase
MGFALAAACKAAGAQVEMVAGPVNQPTPIGVRRFNVETAQQMLEKTKECASRADIFVATAAVADYRPSQVHDNKIKKSSEWSALELERTTDILADISLNDSRLFTVGFAAETNDLERYARDKLKRKNLDMICANKVGDGFGFDADDNALSVFWPGGQEHLLRQPKSSLAAELVELIATRFAAGDEPQERAGPA